MLCGMRAYEDHCIKFQNAEAVSGLLSAKINETAAAVQRLADENAALRAENIEIRFKSYEGIKAPSSALHIKDGKKGVYVLISSQVKFRQADILYSNDDYVLLSYDASASNGIRIYDKIITQGKDLEDGKVYT